MQEQCANCEVEKALHGSSHGALSSVPWDHMRGGGGGANGRTARLP